MMRYFGLLLLLITAIVNAADIFSQKHTQLNSVNTKIAAMKKNVQLTQQQQAELAKMLKEADRDIQQITISMHTIQQQINEKKAAVEMLKQQLEVLQRHLEQEKNMLAEQLRVTYQLGQYDYLALLLNQQDPSQAQRWVTYYQYIHQARVETLKTIQGTEKAIMDNQALVVQDMRQLEVLYERNQQKKNALQSSQKQRQHIVRRLNLQLKTQYKTLATYEANKKELERLIVRLRGPKKVTPPKAAVSIVSTSFGKMKHHLPWPVQGKILHNMVVRDGVTILAQEGIPVKAVHSGKVVFADSLNGFGLLIIIDHGQGFMTLYGNNQALYHKRGDRVNTGDLIAHVGHTGIIPQSGAYFEVRYYGRPQNPLQWLSPGVTR